MTGLLRKIMPVVPSRISHDDVVVDDDDDYDVEYSFAVEYNGPPVGYVIPQVVPVDVDYIPTASAVVSASLLNNLSVPVIQPIQKRENLGKNFPKDSNLSFKAAGSRYLLKDSKGSAEEGLDRVLSGELVEPGTVELLNVDGMPCESSNVIDGSGVLGLTSGDEREPKLFDGLGSSGSVGYLASCHDSHESTGKSNVLVLRDDNMEGVEIQDYSNPTEGISSESSTISRSNSSDNSTCNDDRKNETFRHARKLSAVRFRDPESSDIVKEEPDNNEADIIQIRQPPERMGKKGSCYRCSKGNRLTEKEGCIVCGAKFCGNCVLRAMGSMPEGRKCITCIGEPINESKRGTLGKSSRLLKRLLTESGTKQIMRLELLSKANQLQPAVVFVNDKPLCQEEIVLLRSCSNPPKKLRPGHYWYDKVSGFWGKEGQKPCQIISPHLNIGDLIKQNASNGNTNVLINNREITKAELLMLQLAGVECEGNPRFWMNADGSIVEEGMQNERGRMWEKTGMRLVCAVLSLPIPSEVVNPCEEEANYLVNRVVLNRPEEKFLHKLLLLGFSKSGASTIYNQAKLLYNVPFTEDELQNIKFMIQGNLYGYLGILLEGRQLFEEEISIETRKRQSIDQSGPSGNTDQDDNETIYSIGPRLKAFSDWVLKVMMSGNLESIFPAATREYAPLVEELWKNAAIQATYKRRNELKRLPRVASHFLNRAVEISRTDYEPSDTDILFAEGITLSNGLASVEFSFPKSANDGCMDPAYHHNPSLRYQLIRVHHRSLGENCKWLDMFEDAGIVLFCVDLTEYDKFFDDGNGFLTNKMLASKKLFESIVTHPSFYKKDFLLILNKLDLLGEKIEQVPLTQCEWFSDFNPVLSHPSNSGSSFNNNPSLAHRAFQYIAVKFKMLYKSLSGPESEHKLYVSPVTALEPDTVNGALRYAREILRWNEEKPNFSLNEISSCSIEESSSRFSQ